MQQRKRSTASFSSERERRLRIVERIVGDAVALYLMFAGVWVICQIVSEIFGRMGVG